jgi:hypothetical protein
MAGRTMTGTRSGLPTISSSPETRNTKQDTIKVKTKQKTTEKVIFTNKFNTRREGKQNADCSVTLGPLPSYRMNLTAQGGSWYDHRNYDVPPARDQRRDYTQTERDYRRGDREYGQKSNDQRDQGRRDSIHDQNSRRYDAPRDREQRGRDQAEDRRDIGHRGRDQRDRGYEREGDRRRGGQTDRSSGSGGSLDERKQPGSHLRMPGDSGRYGGGSRDTQMTDREEAGHYRNHDRPRADNPPLPPSRQAAFNAPGERNLSLYSHRNYHYLTSLQGHICCIQVREAWPC